jgi:hypothetical protein
MESTLPKDLNSSWATSARRRDPEIYEPELRDAESSYLV